MKLIVFNRAQTKSNTYCVCHSQYKKKIYEIAAFALGQVLTTKITLDL